MTVLRFTGDWHVAAGLAAAGAAAALAFWLYRRQLAGRSGPGLRALPWLRAGAVFLAVMMLTGPVLHHRRLIGELMRLKVVVDASQSMARTDPTMEPARRLRIAQRLTWLGGDAFDATAVEAADDLRRAADAAARAEAGGSGADPAAAVAEFKAAVASAAERMAKLPDDALRGAIRPGAVRCEIWKNVPGTTVESLTRHASYAGPPAETVLLSSFASIGRNDENVGMRVRGFVAPPQSGDYTFWIASDDESELWLSRGETAAERRKIASVSNYVPPNQWEAQPNQKSAPVRLEAGRRYFVEVFFKEGNGDDYLSVGWQRPDGKIERPIPGEFLASVTEGAGGGEGWRPDFGKSLAAPVQSLDAAALAKDRSALARQMADFSRRAATWEGLVREHADRGAEEAIARDASARAAAERVGQTPRWQRLQMLLLEGSPAPLRALASRHDVELMLLREGKMETFWHARAGRRDDAGEPPAAIAAPPVGRVTDLALPSADARPAADGGAADGGPRTAAVLLSDGAHNAGESPLHTAKVLGARGIPVFTVGFGSGQFPADLAVSEVDIPRTLFHKDRLNGRVTLKDDMPAGKPFTLAIRAGGETLWSKDLVTAGEHRRVIPVDFPIETLVSNLAARAGGRLERNGLAVEFEAAVTPVEGDLEALNDRRPFQVFATLRRNRLLLLEGRPRWEWRYLRNLFDRDEQWEVNSVLAFDRPPDRGDRAGQLPPSREALFSYDLVILGELPATLLKPAELEWLRDFAGDRGGGVIFIDGQRGVLRGYAGGPLRPLLPVEWTDAGAGFRPTQLQLTTEGRAQTALDLGVAETPEAPRWTALPPPHWIAPVRALDGTETLVEAVAGETRMPAVVLRRFGAGRAMYLATDETWRWRREVADRDHRRFWNQVALSLMEAPYTVSDGRASVDAGAVSYRPGERAQIRVRLRDEQGRAVSRARAYAALWRDGVRVATIPLEPDERGGGLYQARTAPLEEGRYEVKIAADALPGGEARASATFAVTYGPTPELADFSAREDLLRDVAHHAGGRFVREENLPELVAALEPLARGRIVESDTVLWQSYAWLTVLLALLATEWILRKRRGLL